MTTPTLWLARRVGLRILCGRKVDGRYVCQGELARVSPIPVFGRGVIFPFGFIDDHGFMRMATRAVQKVEAGRQPAFRRKDTTGTIRYWPKEVLSVRVTCPHCRTLATVEAGLLDSIPDGIGTTAP